MSVNRVNDGMGRYTSVFSIPWIISIVMSFVLLKGIVMTRPRYGTRTCIAVLLILLIWTLLFAWHQRGISKYNPRGLLIKCNWPFVFIISVFLGVYLANAAWGSIFNNLVPFESIDNGIRHIDTLFHGSIAEGWKRSFYPSTLINDERLIRYHTFSHLIMGIVSGVLQMPAYVAYSFVCPVLFYPIHVFSAFFAIGYAKDYFEDDKSLQFIDVVAVALYVTGIIANTYLYGLWEICFFHSESFMIANTLSLFFYAASFFVIKHYYVDCRKMNIYMYVIIPIEIILVSWSKISVGLIFTVGIMYYIFRRHFKEIRCWYALFLYATVYFISLLLFNRIGGSYSAFKAFAYRDYCPGELGIFGHYFVLSIMTMLFIGLEICKRRFKIQDFLQGNTIWIECLIAQSIVAFLPATLIDFGSAGAQYFSYCIEIPALVLLCGHNYVELEGETKKELKSLVYVICIVWCAWMSIHNKQSSPFKQITNIHQSSLSDMLLDIREKVSDKPEKYTTYIDADSVFVNTFQDNITTVFLCPALTGVGVINASYVQDGNCYIYTGEEAKFFQLDNTPNDHALSYEEAKDQAIKMGKDGLIHITSEGYEIERLAK